MELNVVNVEQAASSQVGVPWSGLEGGSYLEHAQWSPRAVDL